MIEELKRLQASLNEGKPRGRSYEIVSFMVNAALERGAASDGQEFEARGLLAGLGSAQEQLNDPKKWVPDEKVITRALEVAQAGLPRPHIELGYRRGGGRGVPSVYWLKLSKEIDDEARVEAAADTRFITYQRTANHGVAISLPARLIMPSGVIQNRSWRGLCLFGTILLLTVAWAFLLISLIVNFGGGLTSNLISWLLVAVSIYAYSHIWRDTLRPWYDLVNDCVVKAPSWFPAFTESSCELEMYRRDNLRWTRLVRFTGDCPICGSTIELRTGKPEHKLPLVGRCLESPYSHTYSFDRMTLAGVFIGPSLAHQRRQIAFAD